MDMVTLKGLQSYHVKHKINNFFENLYVFVILCYLDMSPISLQFIWILLFICWPGKIVDMLFQGQQINNSYNDCEDMKTPQDKF